MKRHLPAIFVALGGVLLLPIIALHMAAISPGTSLLVIAPSVALAIYASAISGLALLLIALVLALRRRPLP